MRFYNFILLAAAATIGLLPLSCAKKDYTVKGNSVTVNLQTGQAGGEKMAPSQIRLQVLGEKLIRVSATPDGKFHDRKSLVVLPRTEKKPFSLGVTAEDGLVKVATSAVTVIVDPATGKMDFRDADGKTLLAS
jgi:alpha-D-xyloside xylohydrolase